MIEWITAHPAQALLAAGLFLAALDMLLFGFATLVLTLLGIGLFITGVVIHFGWIGTDLLTVLLSVTIFTLLFGLLLWKPLKQLQEQRNIHQVESDLIGLRFTLADDIDPEKVGKYHYSGIDWQLITEHPIRKGSQVEVVELQVGVMKVVQAKTFGDAQSS